MKTKNSQSAYNEETAKRYISDDKPIINVSSELETQYNWIDGKRTDEQVTSSSLLRRELTRSL